MVGDMMEIKKQKKFANVNPSVSNDAPPPIHTHLKKTKQNKTNEKVKGNFTTR